jgi:hypothetical protein
MTTKKMRVLKQLLIETALTSGNPVKFTLPLDVLRDYTQGIYMFAYNYERFIMERDESTALKRQAFKDAIVIFDGLMADVNPVLFPKRGFLLHRHAFTDLYKQQFREMISGMSLDHWDRNRYFCVIAGDDGHTITLIYAPKGSGMNFYLIHVGNNHLRAVGIWFRIVCF